MAANGMLMGSGLFADAKPWNDDMLPRREMLGFGPSATALASKLSAPPATGSTVGARPAG